MSRISEDECFAMDMEWYRVDRKGNIAVFCSAGEGYLPEFVCENKERAEILIEYFECVEKTTETIIHFRSLPQAEQVARDYSDKGLYYFDSDDMTREGVATLQTYYTKLATPCKPLKYELLSDEIKQLLGSNFMEIDDFSEINEIEIKHRINKF